MKRRRERKCLGCGVGFHPAPKNQKKQRFCGKPECAKKSAQVSQKKWQAKNPEYFKGSENVLRVQNWRERNPGYWRDKKGGLSVDALQEDWIAQPVEPELDNGDLERFALQEDWFLQAPVFVGLIANLSGSALQEDIAANVRNLQQHGQEILGIRPVLQPNRKEQIHHENEDP